MSCVALGFAASSANATIISTFPDNGVNFDNSSYAGTAVVNPNTELTITGAPVGSSLTSITAYTFTVYAGDTLTLNWKGYRNGSTSFYADYYYGNGDTTYPFFPSTDSTEIQQNSTPLIITVPSNSQLTFEVGNTGDKSDTALVVFDIVAVPEPGTWVAGTFMLGFLGVTSLRRFSKYSAI